MGAMYDPNNDDVSIQQNVYRIIYILFCGRTVDDDHFEIVLPVLGLTGKVIAKYFKFDFPKRDPNKSFHSDAAEYDEYEIISRIILISTGNPVKRLKKLCSLVEEKEFVQGVFFCDAKSNKNALETAICQKLLPAVEYFMSFKGIKIEYATNEELVWRCVYWISVNYNESVAMCLIKELDLNEDRLKKLKSFKCQKSDSETFKYSEKTISDEAIEKLLKLKKDS